MIPLHSSAISGADYDRAARILRIRFTSGSIYSFYRVPEAIYVRLINSPSPGSFYHHHIRGRYA